MLALIAYPAALAYLTGGPDQLRRWFRAKFLNQTAADPGIRNEAWVIPSTFASSSSSSPTAALTSYTRHRAPAPAAAAPAAPAPRPPGANSYNAITGKWGSTAGHTTAPASGKGAAALAFARSQIGKPYRWGATGPNAWDCSGLTQAAWRAAGVHIGRTTGQQLFAGHRVTRAQLAAGDLVFPFSGHVQLYAGGGEVVEAPRTGLKVRTAPLGRFLTARRPG